MDKFFLALLMSCIGFGFAAIPVSASAATTAQTSSTSTPAPRMPALNSSDDCKDSNPVVGGWGYGHGMMFGHGGGMMGGYGDDMMMESPRMGVVRTLNLSDDQRAAINKLTDELQHRNWGLLGLIRDETAKLRDLYEADRRDPAAIGAEYQKIFDLKRQIIESILVTQNKVEDLLTPEQLKQLKQARRAMPMYGQPPMPMGHPSKAHPPMY
jgi:Spy/CpxP family protein refolding chaperone